ncbi:MAG: hypothetical protein Q9171_005035 [Xanthocarpia ochracea]
MPSASPPASTSNPPLKIHTYHCLCSTHLLSTSYDLSTLHQRAPPSLDHARILPLPFTPPSSKDEDPCPNVKVVEQEEPQRILPSLLSTNFKAIRKPIIVQREDGWEKRRLWRCGRCGVDVAYEVLGDEEERQGRADAGEKKGDQGGKVLFLLEGGLVETGRWDA